MATNATNPTASTPPPQTLSDSIGATIDQDLEQENQQLMHSISQAAGGDANAAAAAQKLGYQVGVGPGIAAANMAEYKRRAAVIDAQNRNLQSNSPGTVDYLLNPHFSAIAHDDLDNLTGTEKLFAQIKRWSPIQASTGAGFMPQVSWSPDVTGQWEAGQLQHEMGLLGFGLGTGTGKPEDWDRINQIQARLKEIGPQQGIWGGVAQMGGLMKDQGIGTLTAGAIGGLAAGAATAWASGGLAAEAVPEATILGARTIGQIFMTQDMYRMLAGQTYIDLRNKGVDELKAQLGAAGVGAVGTAFMSGFTKLAAAPILKAIQPLLGEQMAEAMTRPTVARATARLAGQWALGATEGGATMMGQELVTRMGEDLAQKWDKPEYQMAIQTPEGRSELVHDAVSSFVNGMAVVGLTGLPGSMLQYHLQMGHVAEAARTAQFFDDLTKASTESKVRDRNPNAFESFIGAQARRAGADTIYVDGQQMAGVLNQSGLKPEEIEKVMPGLVEQTTQAAAAGDDVKIPTAQYASKLAGTPLGDAMKSHMRLDPEGTSPAEMVQVLQEQKAQHDAARAVAEQKMATDENFAESAKRVGQTIFDKIKATGAYPDPVARTNAQMLRDIIVTAAAKNNQTPEEFYAQHGPKIEKMVEDNARMSLSQGASATPDTLYHATRRGDFAEFKPTSFGDAGKHEYYYFSENPDFAHKLVENQTPEYIGPVKTKPYSVAINNPLDLRSLGAKPIDPAEMERFLQSKGIDTSNIRNIAGKSPFDPENGKGLAWQFFRTDAGSFRQAIKDAGYDGIVFHEHGYDKYGKGLLSREPQTTWAALDSSQIKEPSGAGEGILQQSATLRSGKETLQKYGLDPDKTYTTREVAAALEARQRDKYGLIQPDDRSPKARDRIAKWMQTEVEHELQNPGQSGIGWYSEKFQRALDRMGDAYPELKTDKNARDLMTALIAITSDGQKVIPNFTQAMEIYGRFREGGETEGKFTTERGHQRQASIENNLETVQRLYDQFGPEEMHKYLMQEKSISELKKIAKENGGELKSDYQAHIKMPMAAVEFGPKLGAFYANLMGAHGYLTMDRWWSRTFNRYRGTLLQAPTEAGLARFKELLGKPEMSNDEAVAATVSYRNSYADKGYKNGTEIEKAANTIYKAAFENLEDAPFNAKDRTFMLDAVNKAQQNLEKKGVKLSVADIQAILWYYEKRLYGDLGTRQTADISYEDAAQRVAAGITGQRGELPVSDERGQPPEDGGEVKDGVPGTTPVGETLYQAAAGAQAGTAETEPGAGAGAGEPGAGGILEQAAPAGGAAAGAGTGTRAGFDPQRLAILLGPNSDFSSFAHEASHYYLTVLADLAKGSTADAPTPFGKDMDILLKWFGVKDLDTWHSMSLEEQRKYHEQFAYSFEQYLAEGKAPSIELEGVFERFKMWMKRIYVSAASEIANIYRRETGEYLPSRTNEVSQVMDRMLASDEQIRQAEAVRNMTPQFTEKPEGMSDAEWERYKSLNDAAHEQGATELGSAAMRDMQWQSNARSRVLKAMQAQHNALRAEVRQEVAGDVEQSQPVYGAEKFLRTGELSENGEVVGHHAEHKMDTDAVKAILAQDGEGEPDLSRFQGMTKKGGLHPDDAAERMGFSSGEDLVRALRDARPLKDEIDAQTDQRMVERYGEIATPEGMQAATEKAVHNEARAHLIAFELKTALNSTTSERVMVKAAQATARQMLADKPLSEINPREHAAKEAAAARRAQTAAARGDTEMVKTAKRNQLLQNALAREAIAIKQEELQKRKALEKYGRPSKTTAKAIGADYMDRITELLGKWGMTSETRAANKQSLLQWLDAEEAKTGVRPPVSDAITALTAQPGFSRPEDMTIAQLRDLHDAVKGLDFTGRARQQIILDGKQQTVDEFVHDVQTNMAGVTHTEPVDIRQDLIHAKGLDKINARFLQFKSAIKSLDAALLKMEQFFQWLDTGEKAGVKEAPVTAPFQRLFRRASEAASHQESMRSESALAMRELAKGLADSKINLHDKLNVPELPRKGQGTKMYREELLAVALNMGNESNKQKLLEGYGWTEPQVISAINRLLSKPEMDFVQGVLDHLGTYGPQLEEIHRRQTGLPLKMIEAEPISTDHGTYAGGYYPVEYDTFKDRGIEKKYAQQADSLFENNYSHPATNKGSTIERTGYVGPINLSLGVIPKHIDQVTHDIAWREPITDMNKILTDDRILDEIDQTYGKEYSKQLRPWLQAMANDKVYDTTGDSAWEKFIRKTRSNATMVGLGFRLSTIQIHGISALSNSIGEVGPIWFAKGMNQFTGIDRVRESRQFIYDRSPEMANRMDSMDRDLHAAVDDLRRHETSFGPGNIAGKALDGARLLSMRGVAISDMMSAMPTWMGAYLKGMAHAEDGGLDLSEADAVAYADRAVRNAHGGGGTQDLARIQREKGAISLATMFYSFWNHMYNRQRDLAKGWGSLVTGQAEARDFPRLLARSFFYFAVPQIAHALLKPSPKADDGSLEEFAKRTASEIGLGFVSGVPVVRDIANAVVNGRDYTISPLEQAGKSIVTTIENGMKIVQGEEPSKNALSAAGTAAGYAFGLPVSQPLATTKFLWDVFNGDSEPEDLKDWWAGIMTGKIPAH